MISDLSPGDRLSLKGKLFELQKKLNIIDIEHRLEEQFPYKPQILSYELPNRQPDFVENTLKAEAMRKQRKQLLQESIKLQTEQLYTFAPKIYTTNEKFTNNDNRPVHVRLSEKAKQYYESKQQRQKHFKHHDFDGNKLFSPKINKKQQYSGFSPEASFSNSRDMHNREHGAAANTVTAEEFLYQDAKDRELRHNNLIASYDEERQASANSSKINPNSEKILRTKTETRVNNLFSFMDKEGNGNIGYEQMVNAFDMLGVFGGISEEQALTYKHIFWNTIDHFRLGFVSNKDFRAVCTSFLLSRSISAAVNMAESMYDVSHKKESGQGTEPPVRVTGLFSMKGRDLHDFRKTLIKIMDILKSRQPSGEASILKSSEEEEEMPSFKPKISSHSLKLAERKERKELRVISASMKVAPDSDDTPPPPPPPPPPLKTSAGGIVRSVSPGERRNLSPGGQSAPSVNFDSESVSSSKPPQHHELLIARGLAIQKKKELLREEISNKEKVECTFHPKITEKRRSQNMQQSKGLASSQDMSIISAVSNDQINDTLVSDRDENEAFKAQNQEGDVSHCDISESSSKPAYERLYALKDKKPKAPSYIPPPPPDEMADCTFQPTIQPYPSYLKKVRIRNIEGYDKAVERMKSINENKQKRKEDEENQYKFIDERYRRNRELLQKEGAVAFQFKSEKRIEKHHDKMKEKESKPDLIVKVKLSKTKSAHISVSYGANCWEVARRFAKIYALESEAIDVLCTVLEKSLLQRFDNDPLAVDRSSQLKQKDTSTTAAAEDPERIVDPAKVATSLTGVFSSADIEVQLEENSSYYEDSSDEFYDDEEVEENEEFDEEDENPDNYNYADEDNDEEVGEDDDDVVGEDDFGEGNEDSNLPILKSSLIRKKNRRASSFLGKLI